MAESHVVSGLKAKQEGIKKRISELKQEIKVCQEELASVFKTHIRRESPYRAGQAI